MFVCVCVFEMVSLCFYGCPGIPGINQAGFEFTVIHRDFFFCKRKRGEGGGKEERETEREIVYVSFIAQNNLTNVFKIH